MPMRRHSKKVDMKLIEQRHSYDCMVASLAMITGNTYEYVRSNLNEKAQKCLACKEGIFAVDEIDFLEKEGFEWDYEKMSGNGWLPDCETALLTVRSLNKTGPNKNGKRYLHSIVYHKGQILDPSPKRKYLEIEHATKAALWVNRISNANA